MHTRKKFSALFTYMKKHIVGQQLLSERLIMTLLAGGHVLTEGLPGVAKTRAIKILARCLQASFKRIQFTPDILPADLTGTDIYQPEDASFRFHKGPLFSNMVLADELNRASAKVQSALLEAMAEGQISVGNNTFSLPDFFVVMATQNPQDQEGTHNLPEAQLDRFLFSVKVPFPDTKNEKKILQLARTEAVTEQLPTPTVMISQEELFQARQAILSIYMSTSVEDYIVRLVQNTRHNTNTSVAKMLISGVSPRATLALDRASRAYAWFYGRDFVRPEDVKVIAPDVLRHRLKLTFNATCEGYTADKIITQLLKNTTVC